MLKNDFILYSLYMNKIKLVHSNEDNLHRNELMNWSIAEQKVRGFIPGRHKMHAVEKKTQKQLNSIDNKMR